jgi:hypothetical protein
VTHSSTFAQLTQAACDFWGLLSNNYKLYTEKNGKLESVSKETMKVLKFFENKIEEHNKHE